MKHLKLLSISLIATLQSIVLTTTNQRVSGNSNANTKTVNGGVGAGVDEYNMYTGDGSECSGWPKTDKWVSFDVMWQANLPLMCNSCGNLYGSDVPDNSPAELQSVQNAIESFAAKANLDERFILAIVMQESKGCVRVKTTTSPDGTVRNPGLMQDHDGNNTCNVIGDPVGVARMQNNGMAMQAAGSIAAGILNPCPDSIISSMIQDGVTGTLAGDGLAGVLNSALIYPVGACTQPASSLTLAPRQDASTPQSTKWCKSRNRCNNNDDPYPPVSTFASWWSQISTSNATAITSTPSTASSAPSEPPPPPQPPPPPPPAPPSPSTPSSSVVVAQDYYRAARLWNSGQLDVTNLGNGFVSTNCFASDIANRLTGWTGKDNQGSCSKCTLDVKPGTQCPWGLCAGLCTGS